MCSDWSVELWEAWDCLVLPLARVLPRVDFLSVFELFFLLSSEWLRLRKRTEGLTEEGREKRMKKNEEKVLGKRQ